MNGSARNRPADRLHRSRALLIGTACAFLFAAPAGAQAAVRSYSATQEHQAATRLASSICSKVSAGAVSAIIGYAVPAATAQTHTIQATKQNFGISALVTTCTFGPQTNLAALKKDVSLTLEITSRPLTSSEVQKSLAKLASPTLKIKLTPYSGLGIPAWYITTSAAGINSEGITGVSGTSYFSADVFTGLSQSKLASLAKLAQGL